MSPPRIRSLRKVLQLTQQQLADRIGGQRYTVARWETGRNEPKSASLKALTALAAKIERPTKERTSTIAVSWAEPQPD